MHSGCPRTMRSAFRKGARGHPALLRAGATGSDEAVANIGAALRPGVPAVLLANHGLLSFHRTAELAVLIKGVVEEAAQTALAAQAIGGPVVNVEGMRAAALQRTMAFAEGTRTS